MLRFGPLVVVAALLAGSVATARCSPSASSSSMTIQGFGTATFTQLRTDTSRGRIDFYGGVCVEGEGALWTLRADRLNLEQAGGKVIATASAATVTYEGWRLKAETLRATRTDLALNRVEISGVGVTGTATSVAVDLTHNTMALTAPEVHGSTFYVHGARAQLDGNGIVVDAPTITSCTCAGPHLYDVVGRRARIDAQGQRVVLEGGRLEAGGITIPLGERVTLSAASLRALSVPVQVSYVPTDKAAGVTGTGLGVTVGPVDLAPDVQAKVGLTGLDGNYPLDSLALLSGRSAGTRFTFGRAPGGVRMEMTTDQPVLPWLDAGFDTRILEPGNRDALREALLHVRARAPLPALHGSAAVTVLAAASSQTPSSGEVSGPRLSATGSLSAATPGAPWGQLGFSVRASQSLYPAQHASQWGIDLRPSYTLLAGPWRLSAAYLARFTDSGSPFTTTLDRLEPAQRPSLQASVTGPLAAGWSGSVAVAARYDLVASPSTDAGVNRLDVHGSLARRLGRWRLQFGSDAVLAGIVEPNGARDGSLSARVSATDGAWEFGARARYTFAPDPLGLDTVQVSAAVPIELPGVELRPYLALNFAPTLAAGALPAVSGHGLDVTFVTCCGALTLGYRDQDGTWNVKVAVDLQRRAPAATKATTASCADGSTIAGPSAVGPGTCAAGRPAAGIMAGSGSGPSP